MGRILLAKVKEAGPVIGGACVVQDVREETVKRGELRYLWVDRSYRGRHVAHRMIECAFQVAHKFGWHSLFVEVIVQTPGTAIQIFRDRGFKESATLESKQEGRMILLCELKEQN